MAIVLFGIFGFLTAICCIYWLVAYGFTRFIFFRSRSPACAEDPLPSIAFLKPLKGLDHGLYDNLVSFCRQDYPKFEILIGVLDAADPAVAVVEKLQRDFPEIPIRLIMAQPVGCNPKSSILHHLSLHTQSEVLVASDSDVRVERDFARRIVAPLTDPRVGLVTCLYRCERPANLPAVFEALYVETSFFPSAVVASEVPGVRYGFGAAMAYRASVLQRIGGFGRICDHLADDYQLASEVANIGMRTALCDQMVSIVLGKGSWKALWQREVRWARTTRICVPAKYPGLLLTFATPWAIAALIASIAGGFAWLGCITLAGALAVRWMVSGMIAAHLGLRGRLRPLIFLPLRDCLTAIVWATGSLGRSVVWRGKIHRFLPDGRIDRSSPTATPVPTPAPADISGGFVRNVLRNGVLRLDATLRRHDHIFEFTADPKCLFRIRLAEAASRQELSDGTVIQAGEPVLELHFWNEHIPPINGHSTLGWALNTGHLLERSMQDLADFLAAHAELRDINAIHGQSALFGGNVTGLNRVGSRLGFEMVPVAPPRGILEWLHNQGENLLVLFLMWAFDARGVKKLPRGRRDLWISRAELLRRHALPRAGRLSRDGDRADRADFLSDFAAMARQQRPPLNASLESPPVVSLEAPAADDAPEAA